jgi:hypothetical protein
MRQQFLVLTFLILLLGVLVALNAVSYTRVEQQPDSENRPNRSSYNSGWTGTSAFYTLLAETGNKVTRWQQPPSALLSPAASKIRSLVLIGQPRRPVSPEEAEKMLQWVSRGGRLVIIDRFADPELIKPTDHWKLSTVFGTGSGYENVNLNDYSSLTAEVAAAKPVQPTALMKAIIAVQPSALASSITLEYSEKPEAKKNSGFGLGPKDPPRTAPTPKLTEQPRENKNEKTAAAPIVIASPPPAVPGKATSTGPSSLSEDAPEPLAPVIHLSNSEKDILADYPYGQGRIVFLSDPFIVSNAGIKLVDNATLAVNMAAVYDGTIAFDEYHQGYGSENTFLRYFAGTPVLALLGQTLLLIFVVIWTQGRRFARPLPAAAKDRRSKLEYVAAMADLQRSTRAYDLAIENVYTQTKRDLVRLVGADNTVSRKQLAQTVAERAGLNAQTLYKLMAKCEDIIHGEPTNARETMNLITQLRGLEEKLGLHRNRAAGVK